ncbi:YciI family protein [Jiella sonneratiae]|uniref:YCII-related domain-containing protein n=1 Tax=Jiella sonneratiae TaxID=2816856 RepID=A0ABS3J281_9HYPH|nr:YciI family protein [Jiella sonneratiae]MBO0903250.1 hypothetical protein [Jiella sonneratiae]
MAYYFCRLDAPRPSFALDMSETERALMARHAAYLGEKARDGSVAVFGPVADPAGFWGLAVIEAPDEAGLKAILDGDPVIRAEAGFSYKSLLMPAATRGLPPAGPTEI